MSIHNGRSSAISALVAILAIGAISSIVIFASPNSALAAIVAVALLAVVFVGGPSAVKALGEPLKGFGSLFKLFKEERE